MPPLNNKAANNVNVLTYKSWILLVTFFRVLAFLSKLSILYFLSFFFRSSHLVSYLYPLIATTFLLSPYSMFVYVHVSWLSPVSSTFDPTVKLLLLFQLFLLKTASLYFSCLSVLCSSKIFQRKGLTFCMFI